MSGTNFHVAEQGYFPQDMMHVLLEKVAPFELELLLMCLVKKQSQS
jgi:hypothetical protein